MGYLDEFKLKSGKVANSMADLTPYEIQLWREWFRSEGMTNIDKVTNFFDPKWEGFGGEIRVLRWTWRKGSRDLELIDMNNWLDKQEYGGIFLNKKLMFRNYDQNICAGKSFEYLTQRIFAFNRLRDSELAM